MCEVLVHRPRLRLGRCDWDTLLGGVVEQIAAALEGIVEFGDTPWGNDLDGGLEGVEGQLEADLVVAFAGAAVRDELAALGLCNCDLGSGDDWSGERGSEEVDVLVAGVGLDGWEAQLFHEFVNDVFLGSECVSEMELEGWSDREMLRGIQALTT